jgi:hypothetical protein
VPSAATARPAGPPAPASGPYWQGRPASSDAAVGQATQNSTYLGQRLQFANPEESFDPVTNPRYFISMMRQGFILGLTWTVLSSIFTPILFFIAIRSAASAAEASGNSGTAVLGALGFWVIVAGLIWLAFVLAFLLIPLPAQVSEWKFLVDDKGAARPIVFEHITYAFRRRNTPVDSLGVRRLSLPGGISSGVTRDYLEIKNGVFAGFISCFEQGNDLYVGWTLWIRMSPLKWFLLWVERLFHAVGQRGDSLYVALRYESAKAMRESMHSAAREGVDVATEQVQPQGQGIVAALPVSSTTVSR